MPGLASNSLVCFGCTRTVAPAGSAALSDPPKAIDPARAALKKARANRTAAPLIFFDSQERNRVLVFNEQAIAGDNGMSVSLALSDFDAGDLRVFLVGRLEHR